MASIQREMTINVPPEIVWAAVCDVGAVHKRLLPGMVVDASLDGETRVVTFANGMVLHELIIDIDDKARRFAYASIGGRAKHHNASMQVFATGENCSRFVWITDVLPNELGPSIIQRVEQAMPIMKQTLEAQAEHA